MQTKLRCAEAAIAASFVAVNLIAGCTQDNPATGRQSSDASAQSSDGCSNEALSPEAAIDAIDTTRPMDAATVDSPEASDASADTAIDATAVAWEGGQNDSPVSDAGLAQDGGPPADAAPTSGDGSDGDSMGEGSSNSTLQILAGRQPTQADAANACLDCAQRGRCLDPNLLCEHLVGQVTVAGPDAGQSRQDVCYATLSCIFNSQCYFTSGTIDGCFCGSLDDATCIDAGPSAQTPCLGLEQVGLETKDPSAALQTLTYTTLGAGTANALVQCLLNYSCTACL
jgi:hypothetical protein